MNREHEDEFDDWSRSRRTLMLPPRDKHVRWAWLRIATFLLGAVISCGLLAAFWHVGHLVAESWRVVFAR